MSVPIPENFGWLASSRQWTIGNPSGEEYYPYNGLKMEEAWNFGASFTQEFTLDYRSGVVSVDFYRTQFLNRVITDLDHSPQEVLIYNLEGESYANTFQAEAQYEIMKRLDFKIAYKLQDVQITYRDAGLRRQVFTPRDRFFANLSYVSSVATYKGHWRASLTSQYTGQQRIPDTYSNPEEFQMPSESPAYWIFLGQLTRVFNKEFEVYVGCENIFNFKQDPVIIDPDDPHGPYFDSAMIWGPIFGREWYVGFRYSLK
jgi:outer membrane receptor protein involved in Fe transport